MTIDLDRLTDTWANDIATADSETLTAIAKLAHARRFVETRPERQLTEEEYQVICGWGKKRREELSK
jgi:hypothetical protein